MRQLSALWNGIGLDGDRCMRDTPTITFIFFHNICLFMVHVCKTIGENIFIYFEILNEVENSVATTLNYISCCSVFFLALSLRIPRFIFLSYCISSTN